MINYEFVIDIGPDKETIRKVHEDLARILIKKYGKQTMQEVLTILNNEQ